MYYSLERFEEQLAVLCDDEGKTVTVDRSLLPSTARAGDVFSCNDNRFCLEKEQTIARRERIKRLEQMLRNR